MTCLLLGEHLHLYELDTRKCLKKNRGWAHGVGFKINILARPAGGGCPVIRQRPLPAAKSVIFKPVETAAGGREHASGHPRPCAKATRITVTFRGIDGKDQGI